MLPTMAACGGDDDPDNGGGSSPAQTNNNCNAEAGEMRRLELPNLNTGLESNCTYQTLVHKTIENGKSTINYIIRWNNTKKAQVWTAYIHTAMSRKVVWNRYSWKPGDDPYSTEGSTDPFQPDPLLGSASPQLSDYSGSGYNRGHICAQAERMYSKDANRQTFYLSNMHPQKYGFNGGIWLEMENKIQKNTPKAGEWNTDMFRDTLYVCKGGTIKDGETRGTIGSNKLPVPLYFWMAIIKVKGGVYNGMAFWAKHDENIPTTTDDSDVKKYAITIDELEKRTGIDFFCNFPDKLEEKIESTYDESKWF